MVVVQLRTCYRGVVVVVVVSCGSDLDTVTQVVTRDNVIYHELGLCIFNFVAKKTLILSDFCD